MPGPKSNKFPVKKSSGRPSIGTKPRKETATSFTIQGRRNSAMQDKSSAVNESYLLCTGCGAIYFDKHWHSASLVKGIVRGDLKEALCDACKMGVKDDGGKVSGFGGEVTLEGMSDDIKSEVIGLVRNVGKRATHRDPEERIVKIVDKGKSVAVYTTENQLAVSIGKQVHRARKGGELQITWSHDDKPVRVRWTAGK